VASLMVVVTAALLRPVRAAKHCVDTMETALVFKLKVSGLTWPTY